MRSNPTPTQAQALLNKASQTDTSARTAASWPHIAGLLGVGAASSMFLPAFAYIPKELIAFPLILLLVWIGALFAFATVFGYSFKRGFGKRWIATLIIWGVVWTVSIIGISTVFTGQAWFLILASSSLAAVALGGAWLEARR